jgi:peptidoglycan/xylan/chitin deacetylase (PgdA/CDA1 family)
MKIEPRERPNIFSHSGVKEFFSYVASEYNVFPLCEWKGQNGIILRHDCDLSIIQAHALAQIEKESGVRSSFFILVHNSVYNPGAENNRDLLREMVDEGFEIGLHFDISYYGDVDDVGLEEKASREAEILSEIIGKNVQSVSIHNPSVTGRYPIFEKFINAYDPAVFSEEVYWSESRMAPRKDVWEFVNRANERTLQVLMHPLHFTENGFGYEMIFLSHLEELALQLDANFGLNTGFARCFPEGLRAKVNQLLAINAS